MPKRTKKPAKIFKRKVEKSSGKTHFGKWDTEARTQEVLCSKCNKEYVKIDSKSIGAICWKCTQVLVGPPAGFNKKEEKKITRVRGWKFMKEWVDPDGTVWHKGVEQPKLKGTLTPTDVEKIRAQQKAKKEEAKRKKQLKLLKHAEKQKAARKKEADKKEKLKQKGI